MGSDINGSNFPANSYMSAMRIFYASSAGDEFNYLWTQEDTSIVPILSLANEIKVLTLTSQRMLDLSGDGLLDLWSTPENKLYLKQLHFATKIAINIIEKSDEFINSYIGSLMDLEKRYDDFVSKFIEGKIDEFITPLSEHNTKELLLPYFRDSVLPYLTRILPINGITKADAIPMLTKSVQFKYIVDNVEFDSKFAVIERQYKHNNLGLFALTDGSLSEVVIFSSYRSLYRYL
jgi:hypothetical protein